MILATLARRNVRSRNPLGTTLLVCVLYITGIKPDIELRMLRVVYGCGYSSVELACCALYPCDSRSLDSTRDSFIHSQPNCACVCLREREREKYSHFIFKRQFLIQTQKNYTQLTLHV